MSSLFDQQDRAALLQRIRSIPAGASRVWGKMSAPQALAHCTVGLEIASGERPGHQKWFFKPIAPFFRKSLLGSEPFGRNAPTGPEFIIRDERDLEVEKERLAAIVGRFAAAGPAAANGRIHGFLGALSGEEWGGMMWKHIDHHLRQFGC